MKIFVKSIVLSLIVLASCGKKTKEGNADKSIPETPVAIKKERKDVNLPGITYNYTFDEDKETGYEEVFAYYEPDRFNQENGSIGMDGISDHVVVENHKSLNPEEAITISIWYKPDSFKGNGNNSILNKGFNSDKAPFTQYAFIAVGDKYPSIPGAFKFLLSINGKLNSLPTKPNTWTPDEWYLLTGTFNGKRMVFYVNDQLITARNVDGKIDNYNTPLLIGKTPHKDFYTSGNIDDLKIFNRALTKEEVVQLYNNR